MKKIQNLNPVMNAMKACLAYAGIGAFRLFWKTLNILSLHTLPAREHFYIMRLFRLFSDTYYVWICYANPLSPGKKLRLLLDLCENSQQWYFRERGSYDQVEIRLLAEGLKLAEVFVDIGSNIGVYACTIAQGLPGKHIEAIEPLAKNFITLKANIAENGLANCNVQKSAVSSIGTKASFYINPIHDGGGSLIAPVNYRTGDIMIDAKSYQERHPRFDISEEVETITLDTLLIKKSVLKIDVEGSEVDVIRSGYGKLKEGFVDLLTIEVNRDTADAVLQLMDELNFDSFLFPGIVPVNVGTELPWFVRNLACVKRNTEIHEKIRAR